jgi:NAD(P) transhydrogenase
VLVARPDGSERALRGRAVILATGSRPAHPPGIPFDDPDVFDTDRIFTLDRLPAHAVIVGGGPVGVEFATVLAAFGVSVTVVSEAERLLPSMDAELTELLAHDLSTRGVRLVLGTGAESVARVNGRLTVTLSTGEALDTDLVLFAAGPRAELQQLARRG